MARSNAFESLRGERIGDVVAGKVLLWTMLDEEVGHCRAISVDWLWISVGVDSALRATFSSHGCIKTGRPIVWCMKSESMNTVGNARLCGLLKSDERSLVVTNSSPSRAGDDVADEEAEVFGLSQSLDRGGVER